MINVSILLGTATPFKTHSDQLCQYKYTNTLLTILQMLHLNHCVFYRAGVFHVTFHME